jgi:hypothetical protein
MITERNGSEFILLSYQFPFGDEVMTIELQMINYGTCVLKLAGGY